MRGERTIRTHVGFVGVLVLIVAACGDVSPPDEGDELPRVATPVSRALSAGGGPDATGFTAGGLRPRSLLEASDAAMVRPGGTVEVVTVGRSGIESASTEPIEDLHPSTATARADGGYAIGRREAPEAITRSVDVRLLGAGESEGRFSYER